MTPILGLDVSRHNWRRGVPYRLLPPMHRAGIRFLIGRASIGTEPDRSFDDNRAKATHRGWVPGAYHYLVADNPWQQANEFADRIAATGGSDGLLIAVDLEAGTDSYADVVRFMERLRDRIPRHPIGLYTNRSTWARLGSHDATDLFDWLWQALYLLNHQSPPITVPAKPPRGFGGLPTTMWQPGPFVFGGHRLDGDTFYSSMAELHALATQRERVPIESRPAYRAGYVSMVATAALAVETLLISDGSPANKAGQTAARDDAADAVRELRLVP